VLGSFPYEEVVHRDNLAVISRDGPDETAPDNGAAMTR
jgi:hypothetical protein